jgi:hypothetical protein
MQTYREFLSEGEYDQQIINKAISLEREDGKPERKKWTVQMAHKVLRLYGVEADFPTLKSKNKVTYPEAD